MQYLLDTNICIAILHKPEASLLNKLAGFEANDFSLCSIVKAELYYGARKSQRVTQNLQILEQFFSVFESVEFTDKSAEFYGFNRALLSKNGNIIGSNDLFIASIALAHDLTLLSRNFGEFSRVPGLKLEVW